MLNFKSLLKVSAGLILVSTIGVSTKAQAQSADVPFGGTIPSNCVFGTPTPGILVKTGTFAAIEGSTGVSGVNFGTAGKVSVNCSTGATLTVAAPTAVVVPATFVPAKTQSVVQRGTNTALTDFASANTGGPFWPASAFPAQGITLPAGNSDLNVAMVAGDVVSGSIPSGSYSYYVRVTVAPN